MISDGILDDLEQFLLRVDRSDGESVQQLNHKTGESLECPGNADSWADLDQDAFGGVDIDLQLAGFVDGRVEQSKQTLHVEVSSPLPRSASMWDV